MVALKLLLLLSAISIVRANPKPDSKIVSQKGASITVTTPLGAVQGQVLTSRLGKQIFAFRGVRYANAPINELRFQPPVPVHKWEGVFNASVDGPACPQPADIDTSEDCLLLNVYSTKVPKIGDNPKRPVMVFFHFGDFISGSGDSSVLGPKYLLDQDIVLVVPNYRLGPLGFLSTGTKEAPGNLGLKDQLEALKWVKANIAVFGGDPDCVTLAGHGAGAASVTLHLVSPLSKGLFHKAIVMSGSSLANVPVYTDQLDVTKKLARLVNCTTETPSSMIECLRTKTHQELAQTAPKLREFGPLDPYYIWLPVIEPSLGQVQFLAEHPAVLLTKEETPKVPLLAGVTTDEIVNHAFAVIQDSKLLDRLNTDFDKVAPIAFMYERNTDASQQISKDLKGSYLENKPVDNSSISGLAQFYADGVIGFGVYRAVLSMVDKSKEAAYYYCFNYKGRHSNFYLANSHNTDPYGVAHGDDLLYIFHNTKLPDYKETDPELATIEKMVTMWGNFVQKGKPVPDEKSELLDNVKWEPFNLAQRKYLDIGNKLVLNDNLNAKRYSEWEKLYPIEKLNGPTPKGKKRT